MRTSERGEKGVYIFFDDKNWRRERRFLELDYECLDTPRGAMANGVAGGQQAVGPPQAPPGGRLLAGVETGQGGGVGSSGIPGA